MVHRVPGVAAEPVRTERKTLRALLEVRRLRPGRCGIPGQEDPILPHHHHFFFIASEERTEPDIYFPMLLPRGAEVFADQKAVRAAEIMRTAKEHRNAGLRIHRGNLRPCAARIGAAVDAVAIAVDERRRAESTGHGKAVRLSRQVDRQLLPRRAAIARRIDFAGRIGFVFGRDDRFGNVRRPVHRSEIPIAAQRLETLPLRPVRCPPCRSIQRKARHARRRILIHARRPARFVATGDRLLIHLLPVLPLVRTPPHSETHHLDRHFTIRPVHHHAGTITRPFRLRALFGQSLQQRTGNIRPLVRRVERCAERHCHSAVYEPPQCRESRSRDQVHR